jgi:DNA polymerase II large subunit
MDFDYYDELRNEYQNVVQKMREENPDMITFLIDYEYENTRVSGLSTRGKNVSDYDAYFKLIRAVLQFSESFLREDELERFTKEVKDLV